MLQYEVWPPFAPDTLYTVDDFTDGKLHGKYYCMRFFSFVVEQCLHRDGGLTSETFVTFDFTPPCLQPNQRLWTYIIYEYWAFKTTNGDGAVGANAQAILSSNFTHCLISY